MNRYDVASVAKFNPLSFQEILLAPTMMRKNHDATIALAQSSVLKPDPLDVHYNRAMELKNQMDSEIAKNVEELNKEGFNSASYQNVQKLNRQYQDLISPTGEIGQINNAKKVYAENYKEFLDDATKNKGWSRERAIDNWQNRFANKYTGFGEDGKSITNIGQYGAPKKIEVLDKLKDVHSLLGEQVVREMRASGYSFAPSPDGGMVMVDRSGRRIETSNKRNLNNALALLQNQFVDKEWKDSMQFEGANPLNVASQITNGVNAMLKTGVVDNRSENAQYIAPSKADESKSNDGELEGINVEGVDITSNSDLLNNLNGNSESYNNGAYSGGTGGGGQYVPKLTGKNAVNKALETQEYKQLARSVTRGIPSLVGKDYKSKEVQDAVKKYLEENKTVTIQNKYVDPNVDKTALMFSSKEIPKDKNAASALILERTQRGAYEMVDENGETLNKNDLGKYTFTYSGDMTAKSKVNKFKNPKQNIGARTGVLIDKETGETKTVYVSRSSDDFDTPQYKAMKTINEISNIVDTKPGIYHKLNVPLFKEYGLKNTEVKYNKNSRTYNISYTDNDGEKVDEQFTDPQFQEWIYNAQNNLNN